MKKVNKKTPAQEFMEWLRAEKRDANMEAMGSGSSWNHAYSSAFNSVFYKANKLLGSNKKKITKTVTKTKKNR